MPVQHLDVPTPDGTADAVLARPARPGTYPGVVLLPDGLGMRKEFEDIAQKVADQGYVVLTPNIFYRAGRSPVFDGPLDFSNSGFQAQFHKVTAQLPPDAMVRDGIAYVTFLGGQPHVAKGPMGAVGFCFSGAFALRVAAAQPQRIKAAASFHGGRLATDAAESPHLVLPQVTARLYFGHADEDRSMTPEMIAKLEQALAAWGGRWESELYEGARHGWMVHGRDIYNPTQAERGFGTLFALLKETLA